MDISQPASGHDNAPTQGHTDNTTQTDNEGGVETVETEETAAQQAPTVVNASDSHGACLRLVNDDSAGPEALGDSDDLEAKADDNVVSSDEIHSEGRCELPEDHSGVLEAPAAAAANASPGAADAPPSPVTNESGKSQVVASVSLVLLSLPMDSLHCVASFLRPYEWARFGQTCKGSSKVCREIFRRVRMHGFRCATEVVTAWKLGQHADAKELSALYIQSGVPVYPISLGHSYHTLVWRMGIEAKEIEDHNARAANSEEDEADRKLSANQVDQFYTDRSNVRAREGYGYNMTYLEEKCLYWLNQNADEDSSNRNAWLDVLRRSLSFSINTTNMVPPAVLGGPMADNDQPDLIPRAAGARPDGLAASKSVPSLGLAHSTSHPDLLRQRFPKTLIRAHRHLLDQHLLGRRCVDEEEGGMLAGPISLSVDFFHPHFSQQPAIPHNPGFAQTPTFGENEAQRLEGSGNNWNEPLDAAAEVDTAALASVPTDEESGEEGGVPERYTVEGGMVFEDSDYEEERSSVVGTGEATLHDPAPGENQAQPPDVGPTLLSPQTLLGSPGVLQAGRVNQSIMNAVDIEVYSAGSGSLKSDRDDAISDMRKHLQTRFAAYQRRLEALLVHGDNSGYDECILDFWDEFFPLTTNVHYYDRNTAVPRVSGLHKFLTNPCPRHLGIVQCEIERIKSSPKKKGVNMKGRFFPSYEYRLFIRDRSSGMALESATNDSRPRKDTILMMAKNRGRKHVEVSGVVPVASPAKKGVNNFFLYMPQQSDIDAHYNAVNDNEDSAEAIPNGPNGISSLDSGDSTAPVLLGRLQSNFIGTEFQIYSPRVRKRQPRRAQSRSGRGFVSSDDDDGDDYDSGMSSDNASSANRRRGRFRSRLSLRRNQSETPQPIDEEPAARDRRGSWPLGYGRSPRTSRRAIANTIDSPEPQHCQSVLCEEEDGAITYTANLLGSRPRLMDVCVPRVSINGIAGSDWRRYIESCDDANDFSGGNRMLNRFKSLLQRLENPDTNNPQNAAQEEDSESQDDYTPPEDFGLLALQNRPPWWNNELGAFVLNFGGRVSVASVKNFQLCDRNDQDQIMLQFGRIKGRHSFTMDFQYPLTAVQAFAIAISSLQSKISFG